MINSPKHLRTVIAVKIQQHVDAKGLTRKQVFEAADMTRTTFDRSMRGARSFTIDELTAIAFALGTTPDLLLPNEWTTSRDDVTKAA